MKMTDVENYGFRKLESDSLELAKELFAGVFCAEPWNDDWSDPQQLHLYMVDLMGQAGSLTFGLFEGEQLVGISMGRIRHWFTGTEYYIDELCIRTDRQGMGLGGLLLEKIEEAIREMGFHHIFLQTSADVPAYGFYQQHGFSELKGHVSMAKEL